MENKPRIVCFGELLLRLSSPDRELMLQSPRLNAHFAGAEANVAVSLARLGLDAAFASIVPPKNALAEAGLGELRRYGVDTSPVRYAPGRMGVYFITPGAMQRPSDILYDRQGSAIALAEPDALNWQETLQGADWLHISGVTPAISAKAGEAALNAMKSARAAGVKVSMDCNYRAKLWEVRGDDPKPVLRAMMAEADLMFADARDLELVLGEIFEGDASARRAASSARAFALFPHVQHIAATTRIVESADDHVLSGALVTRNGTWSTKQYALHNIVDRIGGGDAFAAGLLYGLISNLDEQQSIDFAAAAACLKHSIPGDFNLSSVEDVRYFLSDNTSDVRR